MRAWIHFTHVRAMPSVWFHGLFEHMHQMMLPHATTTNTTTTTTTTTSTTTSTTTTNTTNNNDKR